MNLYHDAFDFAANPSGQEYQSLIGTMTRFTTVQSAGATTLTVPISGYGVLATALNPYDRIYLFDGPNSEVLIVNQGYTANAPTLALTVPLAFTHQPGVAWCTDGPGGSLGKQVIAACALLENKCKQPLMQTAYTGEILRMPGMRASLDNQGALNLRPRHFPITALTQMQIQVIAAQALLYDVSQAFVDGDRQEIGIPQLIPMAPGGGGAQTTPYVNGPPLSRKSNAWVTLQYTAGFDWPNIPGDIVEAACLLTADILGKRENPIGADTLVLGGSTGKTIVSTLRGDMSGESMLVKRCNDILAFYTVQAY